MEDKLSEDAKKQVAEIQQQNKNVAAEPEGNRPNNNPKSNKNDDSETKERAVTDEKPVYSPTRLPKRSAPKNPSKGRSR